MEISRNSGYAKKIIQKRTAGGGRTGLTALVTGLLFLLSVIFSPLFLSIPSFAIAPALIIVGFYMMSAVAKIDFEDMGDAIPAFLCIIAMPLAYSISEGIAVGVISWTIINLITGKAGEKKISILMYVLTPPPAVTPAALST